MRHLFTELFLLSNLLQMPNDHRMADIEFFGNFSSSCKRISFDDCMQLSSTSDGQPLHSCSLVVPGSDALLILQIVSVRKTKF